MDLVLAEIRNFLRYGEQSGLKATDIIAKTYEIGRRYQMAREALTPFIAFADPKQTLPATAKITGGSSVARHQLTMGDCYHAVAVGRLLK